MSERNQPLLTWQYSSYSTYHAARSTLLVHLVTVPMFHFGLWAILVSPWLGWPLAAGGVVSLLLPAVAQGATHKRELVPPAPFLGPADVVLRLVAEQLVTFPRFVWSGGFRRAWSAAQ